jgi:DNA (cytosine-5)-methyltransferase 1
MASADVHNAHWVDKQARPVFAGEVDAYVTKPRLLDLFCGAGGAAMGYHRAGFDVVGVDIAPQPPDLVEDTRRLLRATGLPYVIENVLSAPLENAVMLCGSSFGLDVRRHRLFESNVPILSLPCAHHWQTPRFRSLDTRRSGLASVVGVHGHLNYSGERALREAAMNIDWMTPEELAQAIPPAMTEHIGSFLLAEVRRRSLERAA